VVGWYQPPRFILFLIHKKKSIQSWSHIVTVGLAELGRNYLDRRSFKPVYFQLSELIQNQIEDGTLLPGTQIPSERDLMEIFGISRNTVRMAVDSLLRDGLVYRVPTKGTFVASGKMQYGLFGLISFSEDIRLRGLEPGAQLLDFTVIIPSPRIIQALHLTPGQEVFRIERLRTADGIPMALNTSYIPHYLCPDLEKENLENQSLYKILEDKYGHIIWRAERVVEPCIARDYEVEMLHIQPRSPVLLVEGTTYLVEDRPIEYVKMLYRSDRLQFRIHSLRRAVTSSG
jgi:GntR family transcriptional regulator